MSRTLQLLVGLLISIGLSSCFAQETESDFQLSVVGELVEKLEPGTIITVSTIGTSEKHPCKFVSSRLEELPMALSVADFQDRYTRVYFRSPSLNQNIFSMEMDGNLLDKPRPIKLLLEKPTASLRTVMHWGNPHFTAQVSRRMRYLDLPYWDTELEKLVPMPNPPKLNYTIGDQPERSVEMGGFCMDFKWYANIPRNIAPDSDAKIRYHVKYDSGGVYGPIESEFVYDFWADHH